METEFNRFCANRNGFYRLIATQILALVIAVLGGCSVYMAAHQPDAKNLGVLKKGTPRDLVLAELGQPRATEMRDGNRVDVFSFIQGYSKGAKAGRAFFHGAADVVTVGLWEVVGTPTEATFDGKKMAFEVTYDNNDKVEKVVQLIGENGKSTAQKSKETDTPSKDTANTGTGSETPAQNTAGKPSD